MNKTSIYVEVSRTNNDSFTIDQIDAELKAKGIIEKNAIIENSNILKISPAYAILDLTTEKKVFDFIERKKQDDIFFLGRYGKWSYQSIEDSILDAENLSHLLALK